MTREPDQIPWPAKAVVVAFAVSMGCIGGDWLSSGRQKPTPEGLVSRDVVSVASIFSGKPGKECPFGEKASNPIVALPMDNGVDSLFRYLGNNQWRTGN